jgi:hypothetical protein
MRAGTARRAGGLRAVGLLAGGACVMLVASCGGGGPASRARAHAQGAARGSSSVPYRWLVPTAGAPLTVAQENQAPGTRAWRLPGPAYLIGGAAHGAIAGYVAEQAVTAGQYESVYVSAPGAGWVSVRVYRMGGTGGRGAGWFWPARGFRPIVSRRAHVRAAAA